jgi:hypothetical protein
MSEPAETQSAVANERGAPRKRKISAAILAVVAIVFASTVWVSCRVSSDDAAAPVHTETERAEAKKNICAATDLVRRGLEANTNTKPARGPRDRTGSLAVAANARLALSDGGQYLLAKLNPATPPELADAVRKFAITLTDIGAAATAGTSNSEPEQAARLRDVNAANATIIQLCK